MKRINEDYICRNESNMVVNMPKLADKNTCVGCTACVYGCPKQCLDIKFDVDGFAYPKLISPLECAECGMCELICPVQKNEILPSKVPLAFAALSLDDEMRKESSSGGIFTELAKSIIKQNGVVYGAAYDNLFRVYHCCIDNVDDLYKLRGAKYSESYLGSSYIDVFERVKKGQKVLFAGTPCQVAGLKSFLRDEFDNLFCIDFVCHGVPSPAAWKSYVEFRARKDADGDLPNRINLREKNTGWSKYQYSNVFEYDNGRVHSVLSSQSLFMKLFVGDYISRISCEECKFKGYTRCSDITLGDFWGIWDLYPEMDDNKGTSVVLIQSEKGHSLWSDIKSSVKYKEVSLEHTSRQNTSILISSHANANRELVLKKMRDGEIDACAELISTKEIHKVSLLSRIKGKLQRLMKV